MLKGIPPILSPGLLKALCEMGHGDVEMAERFAFYERAKKACLIIATGETAIYSNVLLKKGVVKP